MAAYISSLVGSAERDAKRSDSPIMCLHRMFQNPLISKGDLKVSVHAELSIEARFYVSKALQTISASVLASDYYLWSSTCTYSLRLTYKGCIHKYTYIVQPIHSVHSACYYYITQYTSSWMNITAYSNGHFNGCKAEKVSMHWILAQGQVHSWLR